MQTTDYQAKQAARKMLAQTLQATHPHLVPVNGQCACVTAAKNIRIELKRAFPAVKFSVKTRKFSGGDAIDVSWVDGPTTGMVDAIIDRYQSGSFDGMTDCYNYEANAWTDAFGDSKYIHSRREYSDAFVARAIKYAKHKYGSKVNATVEQYRSGALWSVLWCENGSFRDNVQELISHELSKRAACLPQ